MSEGTDNRISEIDNRSRKNESDIENLFSGLSELQGVMDQFHKGIQMYAIQILSGQVMNEALPRYMAGYVKGDYQKEIEARQNADPNSDALLLDKGNDFDQPRFKDVVGDVAQFIMATRAEAMRKQQEEATPKIVVPGGAATNKPTIRLVK